MNRGMRKVGTPGPPLFDWLQRGLLPVLLLAAGIALRAAPAKVVRVGVFPFLPGIFQDAEGNAKGFFVDMLGEVARKENWELRFVPGSWAEGLERVQRGEVDLLTSVAYTEERERFLSYGQVPAFTVWSLLYANPKVPIQSVLDVKGRRVAIMRNDVNGLHFKQLVGTFNIPCEFVEYPGFPDVLKAVAEAQVDAGVTVNTFGYAKEQEFGVVRTPVVFNPFNLFFATGKGRNDDVLAALDSYLKAGKVDPASSYQRALDRWLNADASHTLPAWVARAGVSALLLLGLSWGAVVFFRKQVARATAEIRGLNAGLQGNSWSTSGRMSRSSTWPAVSPPPRENPSSRIWCPTWPGLRVRISPSWARPRQRQETSSSRPWPCIREPGPGRISAIRPRGRPASRS